MIQEATEKAHILVEAIKYIKQFEHKIIVVKYGGNAMEDETLRESVLEDVAMLRQLGLKIVLVHGAGPRIDAETAKQGLHKKVVHGLRVTDEPTLQIVQKVLADINQDCVARLRAHKAQAQDCTDGTLLTKMTDPALGFVGEIIDVRTELLMQAMNQGIIPVISSIGQDASGQLTNINADTVATKIAAALQAEKLTILTNVNAVLDTEGQRVAHLTTIEAEALINNGTIHTGMIPKVQACIKAAAAGVRKAHLLNGTVPRALLIEIFTDKGIGTEIVK